jgi:hypothetical protein
VRQHVLRALGNQCVRCGFTDWRTLQIDHVNGGGRRDRERWSNTHEYLNAVLAAPPGIYQLLCANCNWIKKYERAEHAWSQIVALAEPPSPQAVLFD